MEVEVQKNTADLFAKKKIRKILCMNNLIVRGGGGGPLMVNDVTQLKLGQDSV